jgi:hypothetical protein
MHGKIHAEAAQQAPQLRQAEGVVAMGGLYWRSAGLSSHAAL